MFKRARKILRLFKKAFLIFALLILTGIIVAVTFFWNDAVSDKYDVSIDADKIPKFKQTLFLPTL